MPLIELPRDEHLKVFWEIVEFGPITRLPDDLYVVQPAHLQFLDQKGIHYTLKDWNETMAAVARRNGSKERQT